MSTDRSGALASTRPGRPGRPRAERHHFGSGSRPVGSARPRSRRRIGRVRGQRRSTRPQHRPSPRRTPTGAHPLPLTARRTPYLVSPRPLAWVQDDDASGNRVTFEPIPATSQPLTPGDEVLARQIAGHRPRPGQVPPEQRPVGVQCDPRVRLEGLHPARNASRVLLTLAHRIALIRRRIALIVK